MWKKNASPKVLKATEKYIASIGRKREELTEEQWNLMVNYIKTRRLAIPLLIFVGLFSAVMTFAFWHLGHKYVTKAIPHHTVTISFDDKREFISLSPEEIRQYFNYVTDCYMNAGMNFMLTVFMLIFFIGGMTIARITNRKAHRTLLSRPTKAEVVV